MKYVLMIYGNEDIWNSFAAEDFQTLVQETDAHNAALIASGEMVGAYGVLDQALAKTVTVVDGAPVVSDGPYIEAKEYLASFTIVDVENDARALEIAAANPVSRFTKIEIRPLMSEGAPEL
jgi:hypothetical protein